MIDQYLKPNVKRGAIYYAVVAIVLGIISLIPVLGCIALPVTCIAALLLPFAIGWLVAQWGSTGTMAMTTTPLAVKSDSPYATPAVDGAVATGVGALVSGVIVWIAGLILSGLFATVTSANAGEAGQAAAGLAVGGAFGIIGIIFGVIIAAVAGAIGGAIYVAMRQQRPTAAPPSPPPTM
jgi:hypothetical protein